MEKLNPIPQKQYHIIIEKQPIPNAKNFLGVEYDSWTLILGFLVPLLSFILGYILAVLVDKRGEKKDLKLTSDSFFVWIHRTLKSSKTLLEEIEKRKNEAFILDGFQVAKPDFINLHLNRVISDQKLLYKAFVKLKKGNPTENISDYSKIIVDIDFLGDFQKALLENSQYIIEDFARLFTQWNDSVSFFHRAKHILIGRRANDNDPKLNVINDCFNEWYKTDQQGLSNTNKFLDGLEPILQDFYRDNPTDDELADLLSRTQQIKVLYRQFIFERDRVVDLLSNFHKQLDETIIEMNNLSDKIRNKKNKFFYL